jgi:hypothetical protein
MGAARRLPGRQRHVDRCFRQSHGRGIAERNSVPFRFVTYALYGMPLMVVSVAICHVYVWWRYF